MHPKFTKKTQFRALAIVSVMVALPAVVLYLFRPEVFTNILGTIPPMIAFIFILLVNFPIFLYLLSETPFLFYRRKSVKVYAILMGIAILFGSVVIPADVLWVDYPMDINVLLPESLMYYPVMGFIAETVFHLVPLTLIIILLGSISPLRKSTALCIALISTTFFEPAFQMVMGDYDSTTRIFTGFLVWFFSTAQLLIFKYFDWVSMYVLRLFYYLIWHIIWGEMRLECLVPGA